MIPGMNPRAMRQAMKRMGIQQQEIDAVEVIIRTSDKEIIIREPQVSKVNMMGQQTYQIVGEEEERDLDKEPEINEEDIKTVMEQAGVDENTAIDAIKKNSGDLAAAIMGLKE
ncbi:nascent polypeptide-associated complex protein [Candidatus Woesearchaeota archaeon]|nr:nascent polypeptide-associated complex protein [Candidatus Woesearchaeota archaeon]